ncbi:MAG: DUF2207 domain-containing protein, partial [Acidimicrobiia bacterium]|nr:DUF2207 domain-containing protein [Acidimicrobiia bacterium]
MSRRRRIDAFVLVGLCLLLGAGASVAAAVGDTERIADYWASATVVEGEAQVVEVIDYDFGVNSRRGILRDADDLEPQADVAVSSPTAPDQFTATAIPGGTQLRIGDPDVTITGRHRYTIEYPLSTLVQGDTVSWNAIGTAWDVGTSDFELHLLVDRELTGIECSKGQRGAIGGCTAEQVEAGHLVVDGG